MAELEKPFELLDLAHDESMTFGVTRYQEGTMPIVDRATKQPKEIPVLRVFVRPADKSHGMPYWDISATTLQAQLKPFLDNAATRGKTFTVHAQGVRPAKRFSLTVA